MKIQSTFLFFFFSSFQGGRLLPSYGLPQHPRPHVSAALDQGERKQGKVISDAHGNCEGVRDKSLMKNCFFSVVSV